MKPKWTREQKRHARPVRTTPSRSRLLDDLTRRVTRVTLVGDAGVIWERYDLASVALSLQDDGRTLKVFVRPAKFLKQPVIETDPWPVLDYPSVGEHG